MEPCRCRWCNPNNPLYIRYHDEEWGQIRLDDAYLFEMLVLESFQAGLSWECVLNKREAFREAFDEFDPVKISQYDEIKVTELKGNPGIIRNSLKIKATIKNAQIFLDIQKEYGSFRQYLATFTHEEVIYDYSSIVSPLSDALSADLYKRGMRFVGSVIIYSYLQAIGIIQSHHPDCFLYKK